MKKENIHLFDLRRILQGEVPLEFYIELFIRGLFVYLMITFGMKYMGKRITAALTRSELAAIASLAAATGLVVMAPDKGLLEPVIVLGVMVSIKWVIDRMNYRSARFEKLTVGHYGVLVKNGVLHTHEMMETRISKEQLFAKLRGSGIVHLGMVKRLYIEANGKFSLVKDTEKRTGLAVIPAWDHDFIDRLPHASAIIVCSHCGKEKEKAQERCTNCGVTEWEHPVESPA